LSKKIKRQRSLRQQVVPTQTNLDNALGFVGAGRTRLIGPAVYKARRGIEAEMKKMIVKTIATVQKDI
jgi:hypothetical protein